MAKITYIEHDGTEHVIDVKTGLTVMEGAVMQARTYRDVAFFDRAVAQLRQYFQAMMMEGAKA